MAEVDYRTIEKFASKQFKKLPDVLSEDNIEAFENILYSVDELCADNPRAYRLTMPFHKLTFGWQSAFAHGFTWKDFLNDIIDNNYINIRKNLNCSLPSVVFYNNSGEDGFSIGLVIED